MTRASGGGAAIAGDRSRVVLDDLDEIWFDPESKDGPRRLGVEDLHHRLAWGGRADVRHDVGEAAGPEDHDGLRAVEPGFDGLVGFFHDPSPERQVFEPGPHRLGAPVLRPARNDQRRQRRLSGQIRIDVGRHPPSLGRRPGHHLDDGGGAPLLVALDLHVGELADQTGPLADQPGFFDAGPGAVTVFRGRPIVVREEGPPPPRRLQNLDHFVGRGEIRRFVVEPGRNTEGAVLEAPEYQSLHLFNID